MRIEDSDLKDLRQKAIELGSAFETLASLLEEEAVRLKRRDEVTRLTALCATTLQEMESVKDEETIAKSGYSQVKLKSSLFELAVCGLIAATSQDRVLKAISRNLLAGSGSREPTFGTVLVRIGPKGLPDDVDVVCISRLARETNRDEFRVMSELEKHGYLLFSEKSFSLLVDTLSDEILKGQLNLPVSPERICQIQVSHPLRLNPQNKD